MKLKIKNINRISEAEIEQDGLTVIAGVNSTGKSTVGKVLFSMIKACNNAYEAHGENRTHKLNKEVEALYDILNDYLCSTEGKGLNENDIALRFPLPVSLFKKKIENYVSSDAWVKMKEDYTSFFDSISMAEGKQTLFMSKIENIFILTSDGNGAADSKVEFDKFVESEFMGKLCSVGTTESTIELADSSGFRLNVELADNMVKHVYNQKVSSCVDATYVESPLYLHILDSIILSVTSLERTDTPVINKAVVPAHIKDFAEKVDAIRNAGIHKKNILSEDISNVSGGSFEYNKETRQIVYSIGDNSFNPINVASGMKSFGLLQLLLDMNFINEKKMLIWDEPENHLHPEWQVEFAKVLVELAKNGIKILVSTHSPYFLQSVRFHAAKFDAEGYINYYMTEDDGKGLSVVKNVNNTLNDIYQKLTSPLLKIMNVDAQRRRHES